MNENERQLSSGDVVEITGIATHVLNEWAAKGIVTPVTGGGSQGAHRRYTVMQTVGLAVAQAIRQSERGCVLPYVTKVVDALASVSEEWLLGQFKKGATHFVTPHQGKPILQGPHACWVDVQDTYQKVLAAIAKIEKRPAATGGRTRGLAAT